MSDEAKRRKIKQLRALADSTTFPAEAASARAKADKLEGELSDPRANDDHGPDARAAPRTPPMPDPHSFADTSSYLNAVMESLWRRREDEYLNAMRGGGLNG